MYFVTHTVPKIGNRTSIFRLFLTLPHDCVLLSSLYLAVVCFLFVFNKLRLWGYIKLLSQWGSNRGVRTGTRLGCHSSSDAATVSWHDSFPFCKKCLSSQGNYATLSWGENKSFFCFKCLLFRTDLIYPGFKNSCVPPLKKHICPRVSQPHAETRGQEVTADHDPLPAHPPRPPRSVHMHHFLQAFALLFFPL